MSPMKQNDFLENSSSDFDEVPILSGDPKLIVFVVFSGN
jgi:hypothetical protein